jgi:hypothetical protein
VKYVPGTPIQGALYHRLAALIAMNHQGLGPNNIDTTRYAPMVGQAFQKPLSSSTVALPTVQGHPYR